MNNNSAEQSSSSMRNPSLSEMTTKKEQRPGLMIEAATVAVVEGAPSRIRYQILLISIATAFVLYLDRVCLSEIIKSDSFNRDLNLTKEQKGQILGAFFFSYALFQVPAGWLSDRFGARIMLSVYIITWSVLTALTGFMSTVSGLVLMRLGFGLAQAGAYPTISATIRRWIRLPRRGQASSLVSLGGRLGGASAAFITVIMLQATGDWRTTLFIYSGLGLAIACGYWFVVRDLPTEHPHCNSREQAHIGHLVREPTPKFREILPLLIRYLLSLSLWFNAFAQFCINVGWVFLITWLPTYLKEAHDLPETTGAFLISIILAMGIIGQPIGGMSTDFSVRRCGLRWGRILPLTLASFVAGGAFFVCSQLNNVTGIIVCLCLVSLMTDIGNPSSWAFMQDIGGKNTAAVFGWGNMWGNLGAASSSIALPFVLDYGLEQGWGYTPVFIACGVAFLLAGLSALGMNPQRKLAA